ncbi:adhesion G protein-coupled receptor E1-like [Callorhinchus milii]|uniref:adhesion G protein-coupled receptor E1-like n=1 Tax=Callorhinchus milii TaxID=7868 RepID=UPI001C3FA732|nr:adhesion G protein-coupled receptor E1-like [Callorhinchus milii]
MRKANWFGLLLVIYLGNVWEPLTVTSQTCSPGYQQSGNGTCLDRDECESSPCGSNATCTNTEGAFLCKCDAGFASIKGETEFTNLTIRCEGNVLQYYWELLL